MAHAARFDLLVSQVQQKLRDKPWRTDLPAARPACGPHTAAVLEGVEAALRTPAVVRAARKVAEVCICYTADILTSDIYNIEYYTVRSLVLATSRL